LQVFSCFILQSAEQSGVVEASGSVSQMPVDFDEEILRDDDDDDNNIWAANDDDDDNIMTTR
jgi:hypothetical protein